MAYQHEPVLRAEVIDLLQPQTNQNFLDGTLGGGGHTEAILEHTGPNGIVIGCDLDPRAITAARTRLKRFGARVKVIRASYAQCTEVLEQHSEVRPLHGILVDLGLSSDQLDASERGFSFRDTGALDMRFDPASGMSASDFLLTAEESEIARVLREYGELPQAARLANQIVRHRNALVEHDDAGRRYVAVPLLVDLVLQVMPYRSGKIHPATQLFQALRIHVNGELDNLRRFLPQALDALSAGGRLAVISYHSLEDRIVKHFFREAQRDCICPPSAPVCRCDHRSKIQLITKKAVKPTAEEISRNPRSRSARLRVVQKL